jgi:sigma-B regulation protein RsbU (phosphoserine phosphatase)
VPVDDIARAIFEHAARISRESEPDVLVRLNAEFARDLAGADRCSLWLIDEKSNQLWTMIADGTKPIRIPLGEGLVGASIREDKVLLINDTSSDQRMLRSVDQSTGYRTKEVLCVPLRADGRVIGALQLLNKRGGFTEQDAGLLVLLAHFAASAIESERLRREAVAAALLRRDLDLACEVQNQLFPSEAPTVDGLVCAGLCRPTRMIGGDYYDFIVRRDGGFAFTLGDVSGKGVPAAVMMASIQTLLRSFLSAAALNPAQALAELNDALYESSTPERYSTLFCGLISPDRKNLTYINAGHVPPFLLRADGSMKRLYATGRPVGLFPSVSFKQGSVALGERDFLVVVSDGVIEARNAQGEFWEEEALAELIRTSAHEGIAGFPAKVAEEVDKWAAGVEQYDDLTVVAVEMCV